MLELSLVSILRLGPLISSPTINWSKVGSPKSTVIETGLIISSVSLNLELILIVLGRGSYNLIRTSVGSVIL